MSIDREGFLAALVLLAGSLGPGCFVEEEQPQGAQPSQMTTGGEVPPPTAEASVYPTDEAGVYPTDEAGVYVTTPVDESPVYE